MPRVQSSEFWNHTQVNQIQFPALKYMTFSLVLEWNGWNLQCSFLGIFISFPRVLLFSPYSRLRIQFSLKSFPLQSITKYWWVFLQNVCFFHIDLYALYLHHFLNGLSLLTSYLSLSSLLSHDIVFIKYFPPFLCSSMVRIYMCHTDSKIPF